MKRLLAIALLVCAGCATTPNEPTPEGWINAEIRAEAARQLEKVGYNPADANMLGIKVRSCVATGTNGDGDYSCDKSCIETDGCVHAWFMGEKGNYRVTFMFTGDQKDMAAWMKRNAQTLRHEVTHLVLVVKDGIYGHPEYATINGKRWKTASIANVRWPERVKNILLMKTPWTSTGCVTFDNIGVAHEHQQMEFDFK